MMCALRHAFPTREAGTVGVVSSDASLEARREANGNAYREAILSVTFPFYHVDLLRARLEELVAPGLLVVRTLADVGRGPHLLPIHDGSAPSQIKFSGAGRPGNTEARVDSRGEAALREAGGGRGKRRARSGKNTCSLCKSRNLPGTGHTKKSPLCPAKQQRLSQPGAAPASAGVGETVQAAAAAGGGDGAAGAVDDADDDESEASNAEDEDWQEGDE